MEAYFLLGALLILLVFGLLLRKLWLGAALALALFSGFKLLSQGNLSSLAVNAMAGVVISAELSLLLVGAYLFFKILQANNHFETLQTISQSISSKLITLLILCFFLGSFMEGVAGFGIPAMLIAPMLLTLGFKPLTSIVLPLASNTTAVTFGALGTPLKIGLGIYEPNQMVNYVILLNLIPAIVLPFLLAYLYEKTEEIKLNWQSNWRILLTAGLLYAVLYAITATFTISYASVISGIIGLVLFVLLVLPKNENPNPLIWVKIFYPYLILITALIITKSLLGKYAINLASKNLSFYQPGLVFIACAILFQVFQASKSNRAPFMAQFKDTLKVCLKPVFTLLFLVCFSQIIRSDLSIIAKNLLKHYNNFTQLMITPLLGISGSFLSGSATMGNLIFGSTIQSINTLNPHLPLLLALLHTGSAIGNAVSLQNIIMVKSVVNTSTINYGKILKLNLLVLAVYYFIILIVSFISINLLV